ncbi:MAG: adenosylmethionine--8-amino-7-oxononanoate transaminase [Verrucomicrobia bacterium]|nr:adenosylmethionine--8-amino-7-oxononanoate transaminase [Verrucomicrobiota bacterium]
MIPPYSRARQADRRHVWHPFTQMQEWLAQEPVLVTSGQGAWLQDDRGHRYLDGNSSIWTNLHGHQHPRLSRALHTQADQLAHASFLGLTNAPAALLAERLVSLVADTALTRVFYSDDGSTGIEVALKMAIQYFQQNGQPQRTGFAAFDHAYHGDTFGASSLGGISLFHDRFAAHHFPVTRVSGLDDLERLDNAGIAAVVIEPLVQGAAGMRLWPPGLLVRLQDWCRRRGVFLILDEVMTGFGRTGRMFAYQHDEGVQPDFLVLAKGLTGGYLPLGATLTTARVFDGFLGRYEDLRTFFYGHSYTGNPLACAVALANLEVFESENTLGRLVHKIEVLREQLAGLQSLGCVRAVRQCGFIAGIELGQPNGEPFDWREQIGSKVCQAARRHQLLTRPIRDVIVLMLPYCVTDAEIGLAVTAIRRAALEVVPCAG